MSLPSGFHRINYNESAILDIHPTSIASIQTLEEFESAFPQFTVHLQG